MHYRLYSLHEESGRITNGQDIRAESDTEAMRIGRQTYPYVPFEIWCGSRRVITAERAA